MMTRVVVIGCGSSEAMGADDGVQGGWGQAIVFSADLIALSVSGVMELVEPL